MKRATFALSIVLSLLSCDEDETQVSCGGEVIFLEENSAIISDPYQIISARIDETCLEIVVSAGGCDGQSWQGKLFVFPEESLSSQPKKQVEFSLEDKELCEALVQRTFSFDLSGISGSVDVIINLTGWSEALSLQARTSE